MPGPFLPAALAYAALGWHVLPCRPQMKIPLTKHGLKDASADPEQIKAWWQASPTANIAIRCGMISGGLVVIDVDGEEGKAALSGKKLPPTVIAKTGGGGWHYFYFSKERLRPKVGLLHKVDLRAEDSYVVAAPSIHPSGTCYEWIVSPEEQTPTTLPEWVLELAHSPEADPLPSYEGEEHDVGEEPDKARLGRAALDFIANGAPIGEQRARAVAAARNLLEAGYSVTETAKRLWHGFEMSPLDPQRGGWTKQDAQKIAQDLAAKPAPPMRVLDRSRANGSAPVVELACELLKREFPPIRWLVNNIIPEGLTILAAKSKIGKTWLMLDVALAVAAGSPALVNQQVQKGSVLYLALEDGARRIQNRLRMFLADADPPADLHFAYAWPRADEGGVRELTTWLDAHAETKVVIIDTLQRIRPKESGRTLYGQDYAAVAPWADLAHSRGISIVLLMHTRKMGAEDKTDMISGTTGISGAGDSILILERARNQNEATIQLTGRDVEECELALLWEAPTWRLIGEAAQVRLTKERRQIVDYILADNNVPVTPKVVSERIGKDRRNISQMMYQMAKDDILVAMGGFYQVSTAFMSPKDQPKAADGWQTL